MKTVVYLFLGMPRAQEVIQLGANLLLQQCHQQRLSDWSTQPRCESWHSVYTTGPLWPQSNREITFTFYLIWNTLFLMKSLIQKMFCTGFVITVLPLICYQSPMFNIRLQVFLTNSSNVFLLEPCYDVPKLLENQVEVCRAVLSIYRHMIMEHNMNRQTWYSFLFLFLKYYLAIFLTVLVVTSLSIVFHLFHFDNTLIPYCITV